MKNIKKILILLFLFLNFNPAYSIVVDTLFLENHFQEFLKNNEDFKNFQPEELKIIPMEDALTFIEFDLLAEALKSSLGSIVNGSIEADIVSIFKEYLSEKIKNLNPKNEEDMKKIEELADAFQKCKILDTNIGAYLWIWNSITNVIYIYKDPINPKPENIASIIKNYIAKKNRVSNLLVNTLKNFFSEEVKNFSEKNIHFILDIFKIFISLGDMKATILAFMLPHKLNLKYLDFSNNRLGDLGMTLLSMVITCESNVEILDLSNNAISDAGMIALKEAILPSPIPILPINPIVPSQANQILPNMNQLQSTYTLQSIDTNQIKLNQHQQSTSTYNKVVSCRTRNSIYIPKLLILNNNKLTDCGLQELLCILEYAINNDLTFNLEISGDNISNTMINKFSKALGVNVSDLHNGSAQTQSGKVSLKLKY